MWHPGISYISCGLSGESTPPHDNDVPDGDEDPRTPPFWLAITVRRVVPNPYYATPKTADDLLAAMGRGMGALPLEQRGQAMASVRPLFEMVVAAARQDEESEHIVEEVTMHLSKEYADRIYALDEDAFVAAGWMQPAEEEASNAAAQRPD